VGRKASRLASFFWVFSSATIIPPLGDSFLCHQHGIIV
jgi:hypothetical protein